MNRLIANRGLLQIFFSLLLVIVIMFVSNYFVYKNSISGIYEKVTQNNRLVIKNIIQTFDGSFASVNNLMFNIQSIPYGSPKPGGDGTVDMAGVYSLQEHLSALASSIDFIEEVIVFYDDSDLAITSIGTTDINLLFNDKYRHPIHNANYWRTYAKSRHAFTVFKADDYSLSTGAAPAEKGRLMVAMNGNKVKMSDKHVMVLINVDKLLKRVDRNATIPGASLIVLDAERNVILSTEPDWNFAELLNEVYFNPSREATLTREDFEYNFYKSNYNDYIYIDKVPYQFQNIDSVTNASRLIMISAIICAVILSALLSVYLYKPIKAILKQLGGGAVKGNDFRKIHSGIVKIQSENESLKNQMSFVELEIRQSLFLQLLHDRSHSRDYELQLQNYYPYFFRERQFVMAAFRLKKADDGKAYAAPRIEEMTASLREGLLRLIGQDVVFHSGHLEFLALIGMDSSLDKKTVLRRLEAFVASAEMGAFEGYALQAYVSRVYDSSMKNCSAAYRDLREGMIARNMKQDGPVIDTEAVSIVTDIYYPIDKIEKLSNCALTGKTDEALGIVRDILQENADRNVHHYQLAHIARSMFYYMLKHADADEDEGMEIHRFEMAFCRKVDEAYGVSEIRRALVEAVPFIAGRSNREQKSKLNPAFINQYIELHYMENLHLDHMADVLGTSPKYFSNYFKRTFEVNYVEYLNKVRLSHAREFLKSTDWSVAEIGEKTGYLNSSTFTTTFKKYYGVSPSEYRKKHVS
ncbi:helix-turn-helix transcriptional regulator [Paenibacillus arenilitoris]|uniref:AraC family transcriptional regulator n=1 Tax=Paenibacillus arenilitoris TaxID=2772299 RepID=A0A927H4S5_9BACL|nr:AraC family transcriptional regulator [Paenibacillus arenilitoris]MBD2868726.1 AraC family transcriptional regulator [Paenibacillus arenilitoris]